MMPASLDVPMAFVVGFVGSLHCLGMCGPLAIACGTRPPGASTMISLAISGAYGCGRIFAYAGLGFFFGLAGGLLGSFQGMAFWMNLLCGSGMIAAGVMALVPGLSRSLAFTSFRPTVHRILSGYAGPRSAMGAFTLGLLTPLIPCGMLYSMVMNASASGHAYSGAAIMGAFGLGTVPAMLGLGLVSSFGSMRLRRHADRIAAVAIVLMGVMLVMKAIMMGGHR